MINGHYTQQFSAGSWIFREGDAGDFAFLVEEGSVGIVLERESGPIQLVEHERGAFFGEMAIIDDKPRSASAYATTDCVLRVITRSQINSRLEHADPILQVCLSVLMNHLRRTLNRLDKGSANEPSVSDTKSPSLPVDHPPQNPAFERALWALNMEQEIDIALKDQSLKLFYQPIMEIQSGRVGGFEALMRWNHPERGMISPAEFIPVAERSGQIVQMTYFALETACKDLQKIRSELLSHPELAQHISENIFVSVNFSSRDFLDPNLMNFLSECLENHNLPEKSLKIEITESVLMNSPDEVQRILRNVQGQGATVAIDDFGTGYSSLSYLQSMPADTLKIDQGFIRPMHKDERHMALLESIIHLAQRLNMKTVAEGVETQEDVDSLTQLSCDYLQGYFFARPMPPEQLLGWAERYWNVEHIEYLG